jgi:hypothetical protein
VPYIPPAKSILFPAAPATIPYRALERVSNGTMCRSVTVEGGVTTEEPEVSFLQEKRIRTT